MNFFKKKDKNIIPDTTVEQQTPTDSGINFIIEENNNTHTRRDTRILNPTQLQRAKDAKKLAETKLHGLEENLMLLQAQQQWLRRWNETSMMLEREKKRLFELGKQKAIMAKESSMLERYDLFEGIHGVYQKLAVVKEQIGRDKRGLSILEREAEENRQQLIEQEKRLQQAGEQNKNATTNMLDAFDHICSAYHLTGTNDAIKNETDFLVSHTNRIKEEIDALTSLHAERERATEAQKTELERLRTKRQSMEIHDNMIQHGEAVLLQLNTMEEMNTLRTNLQQKNQQTIKRQNEQNDLLGKAFAQYQDLVQQAETAEAELSMHRAHIQGQDGLMLQENALRLKGRRQMLHSALSLWKRICTGYESIEERSQQVTALRLNIQYLEDNLRELEDEVGKAQRLCKEKEYTYLLSKGQEIIQLRADLREGVSCSVCGATHHPYHSDTMLDQSKLIGQMKTDYEMLASEANAKQARLTEMQIELANATGRLCAEEETLNTIRIRQNEDVNEWKLYAQLDHTFAECSESTNLDARTALIRQFIENVSRDAEVAERELETFTFHQGCIARLSEELQKIEQKKSEINVRLNELNTGCQVLSREVEQVGTQLESVNKQFTRIYENMQSIVTIKDWYTIWQKTPEQIYEQIQKLITDWQSTEQEFAAKQTTLNAETAKLKEIKSLLQSHEQTLSIIKKRQEDIENRKEENNNQYKQLISEHDINILYQTHLQNVEKTKRELQEAQNRMNEIRHDCDITQGRHNYYLSHIETLENEEKLLGEKLDLWMHAFNLQHPPVQRGELDEVFADGKDWSTIRNNLKQINKDLLLCQAKVEDLNSRIIALDTDDGRCKNATADIQESIATKQQTLTKQRNETMMQIARLTVQLEDHEKALSAERNSAETLAKNIPSINLT